MYREVMRRIVAIVLAVCMVGSMPDLTLLAAETDGARIGAKTFASVTVEGENNTAVNVGDGTWELKLTDPIPWNGGATTIRNMRLLDGNQTLAEGTDYAVDEYRNNELPSRNGPAEAVITGWGDYEGSTLIVKFDINVSIHPNYINMPAPADLGKQSRESLEQNRVSRLVLTDKSLNGAKLKQVAADSKEDGYSIEVAINGQTADITVIGHGIYTGTYTYRNIPIVDEGFEGNVSLSYEGKDILENTPVYTGAAIEPDVTVTDLDGNLLTEGVDYSVSYEDNVNVPTGSVIIEGISDRHVGIKEVPFTIMPAAIENIFELKLPQDSIIYNKKKTQESEWGVQIPDSAPKVTNKKNGGSAAPESDYEIKYQPVDGVDSAGRRYVDVIVSSKGANIIANGELTARYAIEPASFVQSAYPSDDENYVKVEWDGETPKPSYGEEADLRVTVSQNGVALVEGEDYNVQLGDNSSAEDGGTVTIVGLKNYTGERELTFNIKALDLRELDLSQLPEIPDQEYKGGEAIEPKFPSDWIDVTIGGNKVILREGVDYELNYQNNKNVGIGQVIIKAIGGNCIGSKAIPFVIYKSLSLSDSDIQIEIPDQQYTGDQISPEPIIRHGGAVVENKDDYKYYTYTYNEPDRVGLGSYTVTVRGDGKYYVGTKRVTFEIVPRQMNTLKAEYADPSQNSGVYTGAAHDLPDPGDIKVSVTNSETVLSSDDFDFAWTDSRGNAASPIGAGSYMLRITPKSDRADFYTGNALQLAYTVSKKELSTDINEFAVMTNGQTSLWAVYTGSPQRPSISMIYKGASGDIAMRQNTDFTVRYDSSSATNTNVGMSYVDITAVGSSNYSGTIRVNFEIRPIQITADNASSLVKLTMQNGYDYTYTGGQIDPAIASITVNNARLVEGRDYEIVPKEAINVGSYEFSIKFKGNYSSSYRDDAGQEHDVIESSVLNASYSITPKNIADSDVTVAPIPNQAHTGSDIEPNVVIIYKGQTLAKDTDYEVTYRNNMDIDDKDTPEAELPTAVISAKADGNFTGMREVTFHIRKDIAGATVHWNEPDPAAIIYSGQQWNIRPKSKNVDDETEDGVRLIDGTSLQEAAWDENTKTYRTNTDGSYSENADYIVEWEANINAGTMTARVVGVNEYGGVAGEKTWTILSAAIDKGNSDFTIRQTDSALAFTGSSRIPRFSISYKGRALTQGEDYEVTAGDSTNVQADPIAVTITGKGNFAGSIADAGTYTITPKNMNDVAVTYDTEKLSDVDWAANDIKTEIEGKGLTFTLTDNRRAEITGAALDSVAEDGAGFEMTENTDYKVEFANYAYDGRVRVTFRGMGNYASTSVKTIDLIIPVKFDDVDGADVKVTFDDSDGSTSGTPSYNYKGSGFAPNFTVKITKGGKEYARTSDYTYKITDDEGKTYTRVTNCGEYRIVIEGREGTPLDGLSNDQAVFSVTPKLLTNGVNVGMSQTPLELKYTGSNRWPNSDANKREITLSMLTPGGSLFNLVEGRDFEIVPQQEECWEINQDEEDPAYKVTINGLNNFAGTLEREYRIVDNFDVTARFLNNDTTISGIPAYSYTGSRIVPDLRVTDGSKVLRLNIDYYIDYGTADCKNASDAPVTVTLRGLGGQQDSLSHYCGSKEVQFRIQRRSLSRGTTLDVRNLGSYTYDYDDQIRPRPDVIWIQTDAAGNRKEIKLAGSDFEYVYGPNNSVGTGWLTVTGTGRNFANQYSGRFEFEILPKKLTDEDVNAACSNADKTAEDGTAQYLYTGRPVEPKFDISWGDNSKRKLKNTDFTVTYTQKGEEGQHTDIGTVTATITGKGNYAETVECEFEIVKISLSDMHAELKGQNADGKFLYTGNEIEPEVELSYTGADGQKVIMDQETWGYQIAYDNNVSVGNTAKAIITAGEDNKYIDYESDQALEQTFTIDPRPIDDVSAIAISPDPIGVQVYDPDTDTDGVKPKIEIKNILSDLDLEEAFEEGAEGDYFVTYENNKDYTTDGQKAALTITGQGNYEGSKTMEFEIKRDLTRYLDVSLASSDDLVYNGLEQRPELSIMFLQNGEALTEGTDYAIAYDEDCVNAGTHMITVTGQGRYGGVIEIEFEILPLDITSNANIVFTVEGEYIYTGSDIMPDVTGVNGDTPLDMENFEVSAANTKEPGYATASVTAKEESNYAGSKTVAFTILKADISVKPEGTKDYILVSMDTNQAYTGEQIVPEIALKDTRRNADGFAITEADGDNYYVLQEGEDYEVKAFESETENITPGPASVTLLGIGRYQGERTLDFEIKVQLKDARIEPIPDREYDGTEVKPNLEVTLDGVLLVPGADYTIDYGEDCVNAGTHTITIKGNGGYMGEATTEFTILPRDMSHAAFTVQGVHEYTGSAVMPTVVGIDEGLNLPLRAQDVVITAESNVDPGTAVLTVAPAKNGNYTGDSRQLTFEILKADLANDGYIQVTVGSEPEYTGGPVVPELTLKDTRRNADGFAITEADGDNYYTLVQERDYKIAGGEGTDHVNPGAASVTLEGAGNYRGARTVEFTIRSGLANAVIEIAPQVYDGTRHTPDLAVTLAGKTLESGKDYTVSFDGDRVNAGTYSVTIEGMGDYHGSKTQEFEILPRDISHVSFTVEGEYVYNGSKITPLVYGVDEEIGADRFVAGDGFEITSENMVDAGEKMLKVTAVEGSNYTGTKEAPFEILKANIENEYVQVSIERETRYTGEPVTPEIILTDTRRNSAGEFITAREDGHYRLKEDTDYRVTYTDRTYPGKVSVAITGTGNYRGLLDDVEYVIVADLAQADIAPIPSQAYNGEAIEPELTVTLGDMRQPLVLGEDYTVTYADNTERGTATATIHAAQGSFYDGQKTASFRIGRGISEADIRLINSGFSYTGGEVAPAPAIWLNGIMLRAGEDYTVRYENNVNVGTATMIVTGVGEYGGEARTTFEIEARNIIRCSFTNVSDRVYSGVATSQDLVVTDDEFGRTLQYGVDYTLEYFNNVNPGVATVRVSGRGNYGGVKTVFYVINVQDMVSVSAKGSANSVTVQWDPVFGAEGYAVYDMANNLLVKTPATSFKQSNLDALTTYSYRVVPYMTSDGATYYGGSSGVVSAKTSIQKPAVTLKAGKKKATVSWKKIKGVTGYVVYRSTKKTKGYKKVKTIKGESTVKYINKKLTGKKKYYYKVRAYKRVNGSNVYSKYSSPKSVKAK